MASFRALCLAGVASLVATTAGAADLLPPPAPVYAPPVAAPVAFGGGWYLRGDVGLGITDLEQKGSTFNPRFPPIPGLRYDSASLEDQAIIGGGVGYRVNEWFRADVTGEYRGASHYNAIESYNCTGSIACQYTPRGVDKYDGSINSVVGLANGYVDVFNYHGVSPFLMAGVGVSYIGFNNVTDTGFERSAGGFGYAGNLHQTNFTWAAGAGVGFAVTQNLRLELAYRYLDQGNIATGVIACQSPGICPKEVQHYHLTSNDIRLGFRYAFADFAPVAPAMPLITKY